MKISILLDNQSDINLDISLITQIANDLTTKDIEVVVVDNKTIQEYNNRFRNKDIPTDVISFNYEMESDLLGSLLISSDFIKEYSDKFNHCVDEEFALLFTHGLLHLLGYDHEKDNGEHRDKEKEIILKYNLPKSLIIRNE